MSTARTYLAVGLGSALGGVCRYGVSLWALAVLGNAFPWGTLIVNALGSGLIAWLAARASHHVQSAWSRWQPFLVTGFCAGFTSFSLFGLETLHLLRHHPGLALGYVVFSLALWLLGGLLGQRLATRAHAGRV